MIILNLPPKVEHIILIEIGKVGYLLNEFSVATNIIWGSLAYRS
jgi:hypothetical protein